MKSDLCGDVAGAVLAAVAAEKFISMGKGVDVSTTMAASVNLFFRSFDNPRGLSFDPHTFAVLFKLGKWKVDSTAANQ
jgi:hypothetical protein